MSSQHFGPYELLDIGYFCLHVFFRLKSQRDDTIPLREALKRAERDAFKKRLGGHEDEFVIGVLRAEHSFLVKLQAKITDMTTWHDCIHVVNDVIADCRDVLKTVPESS